MEPRIYLASRSPRRRELLTQIGVPFSMLLFRSAPRFDEQVDETPMQGEIADDYVVRVARAKAEFGSRLAQYFPGTLEAFAFWIGIALLVHVALALVTGHARKQA